MEKQTYKQIHLLTFKLLHIGLDRKESHKLVMLKGLFFAGSNSRKWQESVLRVSVNALDADSTQFHAWLTYFNPVIIKGEK